MNLTDEGVLLKFANIDAPFDVNTVTTALVAHSPAQVGDHEDRVIRDGSGKIVAFRVVLHVDNNPCFAEIEDVTVDAAAAGPCGFIEYAPGAKAVISFIARHPNDFATFEFHVSKGSTGDVADATCSGSVATDQNGFIRDAASLFTKNVDVTTLVGTCPGGRPLSGSL